MNLEQIMNQAVNQVSEAAIAEEFGRIMDEYKAKVLDIHGEQFLTTLLVSMHSLTHLGVIGCDEDAIQDQLKSLVVVLQVNGWDENRLQAFMECLGELTQMIKTFGDFTVAPTAGNA